MYDQHYWADRVHQLSIGTAHAPGTPTTDSLTRALKHTLRPDVASRAQSIAGAMRSDGARAAARQLIIISHEN
jgi:vancomycin aglycone glucosyltransferase